MSSNIRIWWLATAAIAVIALLAGYGAARMTASAPPPPAAIDTPQGPIKLVIESKEIAAAGIGVERVSAGSLGAEILAPATATAEPNGMAVLTAHAEGVVSRVFKRLGDSVRAGDALALVDSKDAAQLASDRASANARVALARRVAEQEKMLFDQGATSRRALLNAQMDLASAEADARRAHNAAKTGALAADGHSVAVKSPIAGRITAQTAALGSYVRTDTELFRVSDPALIQVEAQLTSTDAARVRAGDKATLLLPDGATAAAEVRSVAPALDPMTRTQTVVLSVTAGTPLAPGESLQVRIALRAAAGSSQIVVPEDAIQSIDGRDSVFVRTNNGFVVRNVAVGPRAGGRASVVGGLRPGESIATRNAFLLKAELGKGGEDEE